MEKVKSRLYEVKDAKKQTIFDYTVEYPLEKYDILYNEISQMWFSQSLWRRLFVSSIWKPIIC